MSRGERSPCLVRSCNGVYLKRMTVGKMKRIWEGMIGGSSGAGRGIGGCDAKNEGVGMGEGGRWRMLKGWSTLQALCLKEEGRSSTRFARPSATTDLKDELVARS